MCCVNAFTGDIPGLCLLLHLWPIHETGPGLLPETSQHLFQLNVLVLRCIFDVRVNAFSDDTSGPCLFQHLWPAHGPGPDLLRGSTEQLLRLNARHHQPQNDALCRCCCVQHFKRPSHSSAQSSDCVAYSSPTSSWAASRAKNTVVGLARMFCVDLATVDPSQSSR